LTGHCTEQEFTLQLTQGFAFHPKLMVS